MNKIVSTKKTSVIFLAIVLVAGTITALSSPSVMRDVQAQQDYDGTYNNYENDYGKDNNSYKSKDNKIVKKVKCNNINVNVNGLELGVLPPTLAGLLSNGEAEEGHYVPNAYESYDGEESSYGKNSFKFVCINNNNNTVIEAAEEPLVPPTPPEPPEPPIPASLTVNKQVFGCDNIFIDIDIISMDCTGLDNNSTEWLDCNDSAISNTIFCQSLPESIFDIEVLDDQNTQIQEFEGSTEGTTIQNLEPGTYTVNEIIYPQPAVDRLSVNAGIAQDCVQNVGFDNGGELFNSTSNTVYIICLEYEDEQGNDCNTITLAAGEERTCTVKNYIRVGFDFPPNTATSAFDINTSGGLASSFSSSPKIAQGTTEDDLSALEKITKLKKQWLELLP